MTALDPRDRIISRPHLGGRQHVYRFADGHGLSVVDSPMLHSFPFAWEIAVLSGVSEDGEHFKLDYSTELTCDVEVFGTTSEANAFIQKARELFG